MPPRRRPVQEQEAPKGFVRIEDVQWIVRETLAIERVLQAARQEQAQVVETVQSVETDINLVRTARLPEDTKGKGKLRVGTPGGKRRKTGSGVFVGTQTILSGEELPRKTVKSVRCFHCHERGHFRDKCPLRRQPRQEFSVQTVQSVPQRQLQGQYCPALSAPPAQSAQLLLAQSVTRDQQRVQGRSFALASKDAAASTAAVTGILFVVIDALRLLFLASPLLVVLRSCL